MPKGMTLEEIMAAVDAGKTVHMASDAYVVQKWSNGYHIVCPSTGYACGLTWRDGVTMNEKPERFYLAQPPIAVDGRALVRYQLEQVKMETLAVSPEIKETVEKVSATIERAAQRFGVYL